jgi:catechol 2,3-dioxygenase-like lactoylglutathione lyase family enzyme
MPSHLVLTAPVSRIIGTGDLPRALAFYCDVLGFHPSGESEVVCGPARVIFEPRQQAEPAMLFFECADVAAAREFIAARGGSPTAIERVNWIKMEFFQVAGPDGHVLWFGRSFDVPVEPPERAPLFEKALPELPCGNVAASAGYYRDTLGFSINHQQDDIAVIYRDGVTLLLIERTPRHTGIGSCYLYVANADALYAEWQARGADTQGEPVSRPWGLREFAVLDPDGNRLTCGQPFE